MEERVAWIASHRSDPEAAHAAEDALHLYVLHQVALGHPEAAALATLLVAAYDSKPRRWYA